MPSVGEFKDYFQFFLYPLKVMFGAPFFQAEKNNDVITKKII